MIEDWEDENFVISALHAHNTKQLEERKIMEESEIKLMDEFFNNSNTQDASNNTNINISNTEITENNQGKMPIKLKQKEIYIKSKQKEVSIKLKQKKEQQKKEQDKRHSEIYGECTYQKYDEYNDNMDKYF